MIKNNLPHNYISLGFSCQSKFTIEILENTNDVSMPYDWNVVTKEFVLRSLKNDDGKAFQPSVNELSLLKKSISQKDAVCINGIWLFHDFEKSGEGLLIDQSTYQNFKDKYAYLWKRFLDFIRDDFIQKTFVISNSQENLVKFAPSKEDFSKRFGISTSYINNLKECLDNLGATNYRFVLLLRDVEEYMEIVNSSKLENVTPYFVGTLSLKNHGTIAQLFFNRESEKNNIEQIAGKYKNGYEIKKCPFDSALVYDSNEKVKAVAKSFSNGIVFSFVDGIDTTCQAEFLHNQINFSNKMEWKKVN